MFYCNIMLHSIRYMKFNILTTQICFDETKIMSEFNSSMFTNTCLNRHPNPQIVTSDHSDGLRKVVA